MNHDFQPSPHDAQLSLFPPQTSWVDATKETPPRGVAVLAWVDEGDDSRVMVLSYRPRPMEPVDWQEIECCGFNRYRVTHWRSLPEPPVGK